MTPHQRDLLLHLSRGNAAAIWTASSRTLYALIANGLATVTLTNTGIANAAAIQARQERKALAVDETQEVEVVK